MNSDLTISYSMDFASFLMQKLGRKDEIRNIILFGSVARQEGSEDSDIDIFIDIIKHDNKLEKEIRQILDKFKDSTKYKNYWQLLGIKNDIQLTIGDMKNWKELMPSLIADGITLYGKYNPKISEGIHRTFFIWENIKPNSKRVLFNKNIFGYKHNKKFYNGLLKKYSGERLGKGCISVPAEHAVLFHNLFKKFKVRVKIKKVLEYHY